MIIKGYANNQRLCALSQKLTDESKNESSTSKKKLKKNNWKMDITVESADNTMSIHANTVIKVDSLCTCSIFFSINPLNCDLAYNRPKVDESNLPTSIH
jgi:hypothetical protein